MLQLLLIALHTFAVTLWIGGITASGWLLANQQSAKGAEAAKAAAELSYGLYRKLAAPAFGLAFVAGAAVLALNPQYYAKAHWFHGKLTLALVLIGLHHVIGAKARKATQAGDDAQVGPASGAAAKLTAALVLCALGVVVLVVCKSALIP